MSIFVNVTHIVTIPDQGHFHPSIQHAEYVLLVQWRRIIRHSGWTP